MEGEIEGWGGKSTKAGVFVCLGAFEGVSEGEDVCFLRFCTSTSVMTRDFQEEKTFLQSEIILPFLQD